MRLSRTDAEVNSLNSRPPRTTPAYCVLELLCEKNGSRKYSMRKHKQQRREKEMEKLLAQLTKQSLNCFPVPGHFWPPHFIFGELQLLIRYSYPWPQLTEQPVDFDHGAHPPLTEYIGEHRKKYRD